jgi:hypothetical protein
LSFSRENPSFEHNKAKHIIPFSEKKNSTVCRLLNHHRVVVAKRPCDPYSATETSPAAFVH